MNSEDRIHWGEGWHNNHPYYQRAARQGFFWWEIDVTYYVLKLFELVGFVRNVQQPPPALRAQTLAAAKQRSLAPIAVTEKRPRDSGTQVQ